MFRFIQIKMIKTQFPFTCRVEAQLTCASWQPLVIPTFAGSGSPTFSAGRKWLYKYPEASHKLMSILTDMIVEYLVGQVKAGAQLLQVRASERGCVRVRACARVCVFVWTMRSWIKSAVSVIKSNIEHWARTSTSSCPALHNATVSDTSFPIPHTQTQEGRQGAQRLFAHRWTQTVQIPTAAPYAYPLLHPLRYRYPRWPRGLSTPVTV